MCTDNKGIHTLLLGDRSNMQTTCPESLWGVSD